MLEILTDLIFKAEPAKRKPMKVQSLIFSKDKFKSADEAKSWAKSHGFSSGDVDETGSSFRLRQKPPGSFKKMRTIEMTDGVKAVVGKCGALKMKKSQPTRGDVHVNSPPQKEIPAEHKQPVRLSKDEHDPTNLEQLSLRFRQFLTEEMGPNHDKNNLDTLSSAFDKFMSEEMGEESSDSKEGHMDQKKGHEVDENVDNDVDKETASDSRSSGGMGDNALAGLFSMQELVSGMDWELEHETTDPDLAKEIALSNLDDDPNHYRKLRTEEEGYDWGSGMGMKQGDTQEGEEMYPNYGLMLDLGSGMMREKGHLGLDLQKHDYGTVIHDLHMGIPLPDGCAKSIIMRNSLHTMDELSSDPKPLLSEIQRVLMPGGQFIYEGPNELLNAPEWLKETYKEKFRNRSRLQPEIEKIEGQPAFRQEFARIAVPDAATANDSEPRIGVAQYDMLPADALLAMDALGYYWSDATSSGRGNRLHGYPSQGALVQSEQSSHDDREESEKLAKAAMDESEKHPVVYLVRHGSTDLNDGEERLRGWLDPPLNKQGLKDAQRAAKALSDVEAKRIVTSDLQRAVKTADIISDEKKMNVEQDRNLRPWNLGNYNGGIIKEVLPKMLALMDKPEEPAPGGEPFGVFLKRYLPTLKRYMEGDGPVILSAHHRNLKAAEAWLDAGAKDDFSVDMNTMKSDGDKPGCVMAIYSDGTYKHLNLKETIQHSLQGRTCNVFKADKAKQVVYGVVLAPEEIDLQEDWMRPEEIEKSAHFFMMNGRTIGRSHEEKAKAVPVESYIAPIDIPYEGQNGSQIVKKGSWVLGVKVLDPADWEKVESGEYTGFSVGGWGKREESEGPITSQW